MEFQAMLLKSKVRKVLRRKLRGEERKNLGKIYQE